ncbi:MAG: 16S rRNA (uracil(1498)-N(3))-methyltransferase [Rhodospirillaceae bacterium]|nr:16S rRNA (uracil(1498)-N(3))-methyltransferase [Rhodospirillaceae bacterium]
MDKAEDPSAEDRRAKPRLYLGADLAVGVAVELEAAQAHYLRNVLRLTQGRHVILFNGRDGEFQAEIATLGRNTCTLAPVHRLRPQIEPGGPRLFFAPVKRSRLEFTVEKATELGVDVLQPVITRRTIVNRLNTSRLSAIAVEAAEQCERITLPTLAEPIALSSLPTAWPMDRHLLVCAERGSAVPIVEAAQNRAGSLALDVLIGPEGGFDEAELDALAKLSFVTLVGLGPRILRADTAAIAALSVVQSLAGDTRGRPPYRASDRGE